MKKYRILAVLSALVLGVPSLCAQGAQEELDLYAQSAVLMDGNTGRVLYAREADVVRPMASTTKIMTCILALEMGEAEDVVEASEYAASQPKVRLGVREGEAFYLKDLLYSLMLESHNDTAVMIAEHIGGSVQGFAQMMNQKARQLGCNDTYFITPNGLDASQGEEGEEIHSTTARDLARIMAYCVSQSPASQDFLEITQTQNYSFSDIQGERQFGCANHNGLLTSMDEMISGKTGFTAGAGYCYTGAAESQGRLFVIALLGCGWPPNKNWKWSDARKLFAYGMEHYEIRDVFQEPDLPRIPVVNGIFWEGNQKIRLSLNLNSAERSLPVLAKEEEKVQVACSLPRVLKAPVRRGHRVGQVLYRLGGEIVGVFPVYADESAQALTLEVCAKRAGQLFFLWPKS